MLFQQHCAIRSGTCPLYYYILVVCGPGATLLMKSFVNTIPNGPTGPPKRWQMSSLFKEIQCWYFLSWCPTTHLLYHSGREEKKKKKVASLVLRLSAVDAWCFLLLTVWRPALTESHTQFMIRETGWKQKSPWEKELYKHPLCLILSVFRLLLFFFVWPVQTLKYSKYSQQTGERPLGVVMFYQSKALWVLNGHVSPCQVDGSENLQHFLSAEIFLIFFTKVNPILFSCISVDPQSAGLWRSPPAAPPGSAEAPEGPPSVWILRPHFSISGQCA